MVPPPVTGHLVCSAGCSSLLWGGPHIVQAVKFVPGISSGNSNNTVGVCASSTSIHQFRNTLQQHHCTVDRVCQCQLPTYQRTTPAHNDFDDWGEMWECHHLSHCLPLLCVAQFGLWLTIIVPSRLVGFVSFMLLLHHVFASLLLAQKGFTDSPRCLCTEL